MAPRKSRARKTADRMAKYKQQEVQKSVEPSDTGTRRSPRGSNSAKRNVQSRMRSSTLEDGIPTDAVDVGITDKSVQDDDIVQEDSGIDLDMFVPETPMQSSQVTGRKRALASRPHGPQADDNSNMNVGPSPDSRMPSKKRKNFNTPPRADTTGSPTTPARGSNLVPDYDPTLMPRETGSLWRHPDPDVNVSDCDDIQNPLTLSQLTPVNSISKPSVRRSIWQHINHRGSGEGRYPDSVKQKPLSVAVSELNTMTSYSEALSRQLDVLKKNMKDDICDLHRHQLSEMREMHHSLSSSFMSEIQDLKAVMDNLMSRSGRPSSGKITAKTSLAEWEKKVDDLTPHAKLIFSRGLFARVPSYNVPVTACEVYYGTLEKEGRTSTVLASSIAVQSLIFSLQPREKKKHFSEGVGRFHSEFKYAVVKNVFFNVCKDTFDLFRSPLASPESSRDSINTVNPVRDEKNRIARPEWVEVGFVSIPHIDSARAFVESPNQSRRGKVRGTPSPDDIASHGALRVYRQLGAHLHDGREYVRYSFFQSLGYLFVPWNDYLVDTDQTKLKMSFQEDAHFELRMDEIPNTELCSLLANRSRSEPVDAANMKVLKDLFAKWPGLVLEVQHEVHVVSSNGSQRRHSGGEKKILRKYINLIEVACDVIVEFTRLKNLEFFLRTKKNALKCVMMFATDFRELCFAFMDLHRSSVSVLPKTDELKVCGITLKDLIPGPNCQGSVLESRCLRLTESEFQRFNHCDELREATSTDEAERMFHLTWIRENAENGVAAI